MPSISVLKIGIGLMQLPTSTLHFHAFMTTFDLFKLFMRLLYDVLWSP